jgi:hypothetical protein
VDGITITESDVVHVSLGIIIAVVLLVALVIALARRDERSRNSNKEK